MKETEKNQLSAFYDQNKSATRVNFIKFWLMPFVFFNLLGFPVYDVVGNYITTFSSFAALSFYIFYGFFRLVPNATD